MKALTAAECYWTQVERVLEEERPAAIAENKVFAVFAGSIHNGVFKGLATAFDCALHPDWIFADLVEHRPLVAIPPELPATQVFKKMHESRREALPVVDEKGRFHGVVTRESLLQGLLRRERHLLKETRRLWRLTKERLQQLDQFSQRLARLNDASRKLLNLLAHTALEDELLQVGIEALADLLEAKYGAIGLLDASGNLAQFVTTGLTPEQVAKIGQWPKGRGLLGLVIRENMCLRLEDLSQHPQSVGFPPHHPVMRSLLAVPVSHAGRVYGRIYLCDKQDGTPFSAEDELLALSFAHSIALALDNAREIEEVRSAHERLNYLAISMF